MKTSTFTYVGKLKVLEQLKNSTNGNPRYQVGILNMWGDVGIVYTAVDSSLSYSLTNYENKLVSVEYRMIRGKNTIVDIKTIG